MAEQENSSKVTVLVFTLNEVENLPSVLPGIPTSVDEVVIIDGHSSDGTVELAQSLLPEARILLQPGIGKGNALKYGVEQATGDIVVTLDADGETDPHDIPRFVEAILDGNDFAKGSRLSSRRPARMPFYRWFGNKVLAITYNFLYRTQFTDVCSGFNAFRREAFLTLTLPSDGFEAEQQMLVQAKKRGMKIIEIPHRSEGRISGVSKVSGVKQGFINWFVLIRGRLSG